VLKGGEGHGLWLLRAKKEKSSKEEGGKKEEEISIDLRCAWKQARRIV